MVSQASSMLSLKIAAALVFRYFPLYSHIGKLNTLKILPGELLPLYPRTRPESRNVDGSSMLQKFIYAKG